MKHYKLRWQDGKEHQVPLTLEDQRRLQPEINGKGGANDVLRWIRRHTKNLAVDGQAIATITDGIIERINDVSEWADQRGGFQTKMPRQSLIRAGLIEGTPEPTQGRML